MRDKIALMLAITAMISVLLLVGAASYAIFMNSYDWHVNHVPGTANISGVLAGLMGSITAGLISGTVGYISGKRNAKPKDDE